MILKKFYSPFFLSLIAIFFNSCSKNKEIKTSPVVGQIQKHIQNSTTDADSSATYRIQEADKALQLAAAAGIDSLQLKAMKTKSETLNFYDPDKAEPFINDYLKFSEQKKDTFHMGIAKRDFGYYYMSKQNDSLAFVFLDEATRFLSKRNHEADEIYALLLMSDIAERANDYAMMDELNTHVFILNKKVKSRYYFTCASNNMGIVYKSMRNYKIAIENYQNAADSTEDVEHKWIIKNNIGLSYAYESAENKKYLKEAQKAFEEVIRNTTVNRTRARAYDNLGFAYFKTGDTKSLKYYQKAYEMRTDDPDLKSDLIISNLHLSDYYKESNPTKAVQYATEAYDRATKMRRIDDRLEGLKRLTALTSGPEVKIYSLNFQKLNDSITQVRQSKKMNFVQIRYKYKEIQAENLLRKASEAEKTAQLAKAENQKLGMGILFVIGVGVIYFVFRKMREKNRIEKLLESYKTETRIAKKVHDELANDVFNAMTFAEVKDLSKDENKEQLLESLDKIYQGSRNISHENTAIDTGNRYTEQLKELIKGFKSERVNVMSSGIDTISWDEIDSTKKIVVYRVLQELLVNMKKHSKSSLVVVRFQLNDQNILVDYSDNGVGIDKNKRTLKNGLQNVETRIESISGTYTFDSVPDKGFKVRFSFPK